ncbi:MAG TPA: protein translocase subunit SecD [Clostridia bacterium]|nr:protein translocase subunit SecD [Clostridia bacterium]
MKKKKSIVVLSLISVFIILMAVFALIEFPIGLYDYTGYAKTIKLGLDLSGGVSAVFKVEDDGLADLETRADGTVTSLQSLLVSKGFTEAVVSYSDQKIRVEVPDVEDPERIFDLIGRPQSLEFRDGTGEDAKVVVVGKSHISNAYVTYDQDDSNYYAVGLTFNDAGSKIFADYTAAHVNEKLYIYVGGELENENGITINQAITGGSAMISGNYTYENAYALATSIQSGTFSVGLTLIENRTVSATLGDDAIRTALIAGIIGIAIVFIFMGFAYRMMGIAADIALAVYIVLLIWFCSVLPWVQLTLPGIAGVLLGVGMAVDANVVIFERIKDEYKTTNKPIRSAFVAGYKRALTAIIDGNVTTIIGAVVLWIIGSAAIVGFAIVLFISIIISMFSALLVTRIIMNCFLSFNSENPKLYMLKRGEVK